LGYFFLIDKRVANEITEPISVKAKLINNVSNTRPLKVFVCGEGSSGELGLGNAKDVKRPRINNPLTDANVVVIATGGMHAVALTKDGKVLTWGVNDQGALGRNTSWEGGLKDIKENASDSGSDDESDDAEMNPLESNPAEVDPFFFHPGSKIVDVAAGDSSSFALTADGRVYGWGTFRV
jgi:regulator of chromosome condensation